MNDAAFDDFNGPIAGNEGAATTSESMTSRLVDAIRPLIEQQERRIAELECELQHFRLDPRPWKELTATLAAKDAEIERLRALLKDRG